MGQGKHHFGVFTPVISVEYISKTCFQIVFSQHGAWNYVYVQISISRQVADFRFINPSLSA